MAAGNTEILQRDSVFNTILVAFVVSLVCSILVSTSVVLLRPVQVENMLLRSGYINVLKLVGSIEDTDDYESLMQRVDTKLVDLATGRYVSGIDAATFNPQAAADDPELSVQIPPGLDLAKIERRAKYAAVSLVYENDRIRYIVLPVFGSGMWSTLYGYIALVSDANTIAGLKFYEHAETPGIGDKVDKPNWLAGWRGKQVYDAEGTAQINIVKGKIVVETRNQVDALTGATKTGEGVTNLLGYWFGEHGFKTYLDNFRDQEGNL